MAKTPQSIVEEARKKNAALEASPPTNELDALLGQLGDEGAPVSPEETITLVEEPNIVIEPVVPTIEEPKTVIEEYVPDAAIAATPAPVTSVVPVAADAPVQQDPPAPAPVVCEGQEERRFDKQTLAEIEAGRAALAKYK